MRFLRHRSDGRADAREMRASPKIPRPDAPHIRFYSGAPRGRAMDSISGTLTVSDTSRESMSKRGMATLASLATLVVDESPIALRDRRAPPHRDNLRLCKRQ
jgi:hypothetical protein